MNKIIEVGYDTYLSKKDINAKINKIKSCICGNVPDIISLNTRSPYKFRLEFICEIYCLDCINKKLINDTKIISGGFVEDIHNKKLIKLKEIEIINKAIDSWNNNEPTC